jgi:hypothetical protein
MRSLRIALLATLVGWVPLRARADATDWRFCVAVDMNAKVAYLTPLFESTEGHRNLETKVGALLTERNLPYQNVQCRLPVDLLASKSERIDAEAFVKALGLSLRPIR